MKEFLTLDDVEIKDKTVLVRIDINTSYDEKTRKISDSDRLREHAKTIKELADKGAKVVLLAHQGRKGDPDFIHLDQHAELLSDHVGKKAEFIDDVIGERAIEKIKSLKSGEILLLDNVRFLEDETEEKTPEEHLKSQIVSKLSPIADIYVNDAFSASHRSHASIVGFSAALPTYAGRVMEKELLACQKVFKPEHPYVFILGGAKPDDCLEIMKFMFEKKVLDQALTCGVLGELFLLAKGFMHGKGTADYLSKKGFYKLIPEVKKILEKYEDKIEMPIDVAFESNKKREEISIKELPIEEQVLDIGKKTADKYSELIKKAKTIVVKGPAGVYENKGFEIGTKSILEAISKSKAFSLIGGGDTLVAIEKIGINKKKFSYISLGGGALITYLSGKSMPGIEVLQKTKK